jgi:hypothetical protein
VASEDSRRTVSFPVGVNLDAQAKLWCARKAVSFTLTFGFKPDCEYGGDTDPTVPDMIGAALQFANNGGRATLLHPRAIYSDTLVYEGGDTSGGGWQGGAVYPYRPSTNFGAEGQILYRKLDQGSGLPVPDTDTLPDWAQESRRFHRSTDAGRNIRAGHWSASSSRACPTRLPAWRYL